MNYDVVIVGGGASGVAAYVAAERLGAKVVLLEKYGFLGGQAVSAFIGTICGLYLRDKRACKFKTTRFAEEFASEFDSNPESTREGLWYLPYDIFDFERITSKFVKNKLLFATVFSANEGNNKITSIDALIGTTKTQITAGAFIDCSGDGVLSNLLNHPFIEESEHQKGALLFRLDRLGSYDALKKFVSEHSDLSIVPGSLKDNSALLKVASSLSNDLEDPLRERVKDLREVLSKAIPEALISSLPAQAGIRSSKRPVGKSILTKEDILFTRKPENGIAYGNWPIELWVDRLKMTYFEERDYYRIPYSTLESSVYENLFFAGRGLSASEEAAASARVIGTALQTGYAAGVLATNRSEIVKLTHE